MKDLELTRPPFFPMLIDLEGRKVLIVGGGRIASRRTKTLLTCGANITAVSPNFCEDFPECVEKITREFKPDDISENFSLVISATNSRSVNELVCKIARAMRIPVNITDDHDECDFFFPSLINCNNVAVSVNTAGISSTLTRRLSDRLREVWPLWVQELSS